MALEIIYNLKRWRSVLFLELFTNQNMQNRSETIKNNNKRDKQQRIVANFGPTEIRAFLKQFHVSDKQHCRR